jgi:hypothetical protein
LVKTVFSWKFNEFESRQAAESCFIIDSEKFVIEIQEFIIGNGLFIINPLFSFIKVHSIFSNTPLNCWKMCIYYRIFIAKNNPSPCDPVIFQVVLALLLVKPLDGSQSTHKKRWFAQHS